MRIARSLAVALIAVFAVADCVRADDNKDDAKEVTLKGKVTCGKCDLKQDKKCATVLVTKKGDEDVVYYFDADSNKKYHGDICTSSKNGTVTGTVTEKDGKKWIKVTKLEYDQ